MKAWGEPFGAVGDVQSLLGGQQDRSGREHPIDRIIDAFPADQHKQIRSQLALVLRAIISLKLIKTREGKMTAAVEVLKISPRVAKLIEDGHTKDILEEIEGSVGLYRMQSMNQSLIALLVHQKITYQDAMELSSDVMTSRCAPVVR